LHLFGPANGGTLLPRSILTGMKEPRIPPHRTSRRYSITQQVQPIVYLLLTTLHKHSNLRRWGKITGRNSLTFLLMLELAPPLPHFTLEVAGSLQAFGIYRIRYTRPPNPHRRLTYSNTPGRLLTVSQSFKPPQPLGLFQPVQSLRNIRVGTLKVLNPGRDVCRWME
jgi:hypothetical protein